MSSEHECADRDLAKTGRGGAFRWMASRRGERWKPSDRSVRARTLNIPGREMAYHLISEGRYSRQARQNDRFRKGPER